MPFTSWSEIDPAGSDAASSINEASSRNMVRIRERLATIFETFTTDTDRLYQSKLFLKTAVGLTGRDNGDSSTLFSINDAGIFTLNAQPACHATDAGQSLSVGVDTPIDFTTEVVDIGSCHDTGVNPSRFVAPVTGIYAVSAMFLCPFSSISSVSFKIRRDGSTVIGQAQTITISATAPFQCTMPFMLIPLTATQYIELMIQLSGGGGTIQNAVFNFYKIA